jgi:carboxymethylenebutenolidase
MSEMITVALAEGEVLDVYVARPAGEPIGGLVLIHEIWGLVGHITDVADRFASEGWLVAAPDILSHGGVAPALGAELFAVMNSDDEEARAAAQPRMREAMAGMRAPEYADWAIAALRATVDWLIVQPGIDDRIAAQDDRVRAVAPFYGTAPPADRIADIAAPVLAIYGQHDPALIDALPAVTEAMVQAGVDFEAVVYPDSAHAFFNDTGRRYNPADAADAWARVTEFLRSRV